MQFPRFYLLVIGLSPIVIWTWILSDPWVIVGYLYKLNRWQHRLYARYQAWQHTRKAFQILWSEYAHQKPISRKSFHGLKHDRWNQVYERNLKHYLAQADRNKHPLEIEYEQRQQDPI